jgi:Ala-tRNA(Pro) deacylase
MRPRPEVRREIQIRLKPCWKATPLIRLMVVAGFSLAKFSLEEMMTPEEKITRILQENKIAYEVFEHEPVYTNPAMAVALKVSESETVKSLVLVTKEKEMVVLVLPGDMKVDWKRAAAGIGTKKVAFAKPEEVSEKVGCEVGCVPPFGQLTALPIYMDPDITKKEFVYFNPGVHHKSYKIKSWDLKKLCTPKMVYQDRKGDDLGNPCQENRAAHVAPLLIAGFRKRSLLTKKAHPSIFARGK